MALDDQIKSLVTRIATEFKNLRANGETVPLGGTDGQVLTKVGGIRAWATPSGGGGSGSDGWSYVLAVADTANSSATVPVNATGLSVSGLAAGLYVLEGIVLCTSVATTNGPRIGIANNSSGTAVVTAALVGSNGLNLSASSWPGNNQLPQAVPSANAPTTGGSFVGIFLNGVVRVTGTMTGTIDMTLMSEVAGETRVKADSFLRYKKIG